MVWKSRAIILSRSSSCNPYELHALKWVCICFFLVCILVLIFALLRLLMKSLMPISASSRRCLERQRLRRSGVHLRRRCNYHNGLVISVLVCKWLVLIGTCIKLSHISLVYMLHVTPYISMSYLTTIRSATIHCQGYNMGFGSSGIPILIQFNLRNFCIPLWCLWIWSSTFAGCCWQLLA